MRAWLIPLICLLGLGPGDVRAAEPAEVRAAVHSAFRGYRAALLSGDGMAAARLLSRSTVDYYARMQTLALRGSADAVQRQSLANQMQVLLMRLRLAPHELQAMSGRQLLVHHLEKGWISADSVQGFEPGPVSADGDVAVLNVLVGGRDVGQGFRFVREAGAWRLDLVSTLQATNALLQAEAARREIPERELLLQLVGSIVGQDPVDDRVWQPLIP